MSHRQRRVVPIGSSLRPRLFLRRRKYCRGLEAGRDIHGGHATPQTKNLPVLCQTGTDIEKLQYFRATLRSWSGE